MLGGRDKHKALIALAILSSILGALALTIGMFMHYGCEHYPYATCCMTSGGGLSILLGIGVANYSKWRSRR